MPMAKKPISGTLLMSHVEIHGAKRNDFIASISGKGKVNLLIE